MSWLNSTGLANLAKTALNEVQKQIDKALDIQEEELNQKKLSASQTEQKTTNIGSVKTSLSTPALNSSVWGSFSGSFFENPPPENPTTVTIPPTSANSKNWDVPVNISEFDDKQRLSIQSLDNSSESVDVLSNPTSPGSSMTSPGQISDSTVLGSESVEILDTPTSELLSTDSAITEDSKDSPESVEIISEDIIEEDEEDSFSYNTISESTAATVLEPGNHPPITTPPSRSILHLSLGSSISSSFEKDRNMTIEISSKTTSECDTEDSAESERTVMSDTGKNISLLEDAMLEKSFTHLSDSTQSFEDVHSNLLESYQSENPRESISPNSDEKSDLVKISSEQTSGHTSADETATSSDIEIIPSPNGDSSSTNSAYRPSPLTIVSQKSGHFEQTVIKKKGHCRENSEVSMHSDDSNFSSQTEVEKLLKRISELSELLEVREFKLVEMGRQNAELQDRNFEFKSQLEAKMKGGLQTNLDLTNVTEEYTQRLSALEKRFQQTIRERDQLRQQLDVIKSDNSSRISKDEVETIIKEKEYITAELRTEGEKLSKQILQHSNIIKKLRAKEKENETTLKKQKEQIEELADETERLKKSLSAKDDMERSQIEAVHKFSSEKRKLDKENSQLKSQMEDITQKLVTIQTSFEVAKKELKDKKQAHTELSKRSEAFSSLESENVLHKNQNEQIIIQLENLRDKLKQAESGNELKERKLRMENSELLRRLENAELRAEEQANDVSLVTIPLVKQLESLQTTLNSRTFTWEKQEKLLVDQLQESQEKLLNFNEIEKTTKEQKFLLNSKILNLEDHLNSALLKTEQSSSLLQQKEMEFDLLQMDFKRENENLKIIKIENEKILEEYKNRLNNLEERLKNESEKLEVEKIKFSSQNRDLISDESNTLEENPNNRNSSSPTLSLGHMSIADSLGSGAWHFDDLDCVSNSGRPSGGSVYGGFIPIGNASHLENLQSTLKQRDGELYQLQWELSRLQAERNILTTEVSNLTMELENIKVKLELSEKIEIQFVELQRQYDAILQMYGEKVEETQELKLDLQDVKEMYRGQIDELLKQQQKRRVPEIPETEPL